MTLNELRDKAYKIAEDHGFHEDWDFGRALRQTVCELAFAMESDRKGDWAINRTTHAENNPVFWSIKPELFGKDYYEEYVKGTVEEEIADAVIRLLDLAGACGIDLDWHVKAKMAYNEKR